MNKGIFAGVHLLSLSVQVWLFMNCNNILEQADACRALEFLPPIDGHALMNHVTRNITLDRQDACRISCYLDNNCLSYNFGRLHDGDFLCQLSDSDHIQHPEDLKKSDGFVYLGTENACFRNLCSPHGKCAINPTDGTYYCKCEPGFVGQYCQEQAVYNSCLEAPAQTRIYQIQLNVGFDHFPVYCDQEKDGGGWTMIFKVVGNATPAYVGELWESLDTHSENVIAALDTTTSHHGHYKNRIVLRTHWENFDHKEALVVLYKDGDEVGSLRFNVVGTNNMDWFSAQNLVSSYWDELSSASKVLHFQIKGNQNAGRSFEISKNYGGCDKDAGWLVITSTHTCIWEKRNPLPSILYSKQNNFVTYIHSDKIGIADVFAVFVR